MTKYHIIIIGLLIILSGLVGYVIGLDEALYSCRASGTFEFLGKSFSCTKVE